jgi:hypothetical protein
MRAFLFISAPLVFSAFAFVACSSSDDPQPPGTTFETDTGTTTETASDDTGTTLDAPSETAIDSGTPDTANCVGEAGCFNCKPTTNEQFLDKCTSSECSPFDDKSRIPTSTWDGGKLPAVP